MLLGLFSTDLNDTLDRARLAPAGDLPPSGAEAFSAAYEESRRFSNSEALTRNRYEVTQKALDALETATGEYYANPETVPQGPNRDALEKQIRARFDNLRGERPDLGLSYPTEEQIQAGAVEIAAKARGARAAVDARPQDVWSYGGALLGDVAGTAADPLQIASMFAGAGPASGILRTMAVEGLVAAGTQAVTEAGTSGFKKAADPTYGLPQQVGNIAMAGFGAAAISGGVKVAGRGLSALLERYRGRAGTPDVPLDLPPERDVQDAVNVLEREQHLRSAAPLPGVAGEVAHVEALKKAAADMEAGRPVDVQAIIAEARPANGNAPNEGRVFTSAGRAVDVEYRVVEADQLVSSHGADGAVNPAFPADLQPRDRTRVASQAQIAEIAGQLEPERLGRNTDAASGAPIVGPDMVVESGNGRVGAIRTAYETGGDAATRYRSWVQQQFPGAQDMRQPVLVAVRKTDLDPSGRSAFTREANQATAARLSPTEQALADARHLDDNLMARVASGDVNAASNRSFVRGFLDRLPAAERGALVDANGALNVEGARRVQGALLGRAYGDAAIIGRIIEDADSDIRAIGGALLDVAGPWAKLRAAAARGELAPGMDVTGDLLAAVRMVAQARSEGRNVAELALQRGLFGDDLSSTARLLLGGLFRDPDLSKPAGRAKVSDFLKGYLDEASKNSAAARLPGMGDELTADQILRGERLTEAPRQVPGARPAEEVAASKESTDALYHDLNRLMAERDPEVSIAEAVDPETGRVVAMKRKATDLMDEAEREIAEVENMAACVFGMAAE